MRPQFHFGCRLSNEADGALGPQERRKDSIYLNVTGSSDRSCRCDGGKDETHSILAYILELFRRLSRKGRTGQDNYSDDREPDREGGKANCVGCEGRGNPCHVQRTGDSMS